MTTATQNKTTAHELESISHSSAQIGIGIITILSVLIGTWGVACLIGGLSQYGVTGMIKGWFTAVMGG